MAWREITEVAKEKTGIAVALTFPEEDETKIREKVYERIKLEDLKKETGFKTLLEFLDKHLAKNDLADSLEKFEEFEDLNRREGQSMNEFIAIFDS